ncbi:MAG: L,D-transpeptidase [Acidimicrobiia bacterium]|nr:L,D-transpeptidase [Acidimicrobiia bacterium]
MRTKLGLVAAVATFATVLALGTPTDASTPAPDTAPPDTAAEPVDTLSEAPPPATTLPPLVIDGAADADVTLSPRTGKEQVQVEPVPPPPIPPEWVVPANSGTGRRVVYSKSRQRLWVIDSAGNMIKTHRVSGRQTPLDPRPGTYQVFSRSRYTYSINNPTIKWGYMVRFAHGARGGNIGFHEIPTQYGRPVQSVSQLGQALSGGCVRQAIPDAIWMWNWAYVGTKVVTLA